MPAVSTNLNVKNTWAMGNIKFYSPNTTEKSASKVITMDGRSTPIRDSLWLYQRRVKPIRSLFLKSGHECDMVADNLADI